MKTEEEIRKELGNLKAMRKDRAYEDGREEYDALINELKWVLEE